MPPGQLDTSALPQQVRNPSCWLPSILSTHYLILWTNTSLKPAEPRCSRSPPTANAEPQSTSSDDTRCYFFKLSLELRDEIYDYIAYEQTSVDLYVNLETPAEPKLYAYDESRALSRASSQLRTEYMTRLQRRIKQLDIDHEPHLVIPLSMLTHASTTLMIAERKVSRNVWVQDNVALRCAIPFEGPFDDGLKLSTLRLTVASNAVRAFDLKLCLPAELELKVPVGDLIAAMTTLQRLKNFAELDVRNWWVSWWDVYHTRVLYCRGRGIYYNQSVWIPEEFRLG